MKASGDGVTGGLLAGHDEVARPLVLPSSFGQDGIEIQHQMAGGSPIFNVPAALELSGVLDRDALAEASARSPVGTTSCAPPSNAVMAGWPGLCTRRDLSNYQPTI